jgi:uncharacterized protein YdhG (YjbR/CyaY superfamily)
MKSTAVTKFLDALNHPFRAAIEELRNDILSANDNLTENIKWNGPNYCYNHLDRITMKIQPPNKQVQLILHRGASKQTPPKDKIISTTSELLIWKANDRAIITFKSLEAIKNGKPELIVIINEWINATT